MNKYIKILTTGLAIFSSPYSFAKNITYFEIERMSIGDSALQFISAKDLLALQTETDQNAEYKESVFIPNNKESEYSIVSIWYKNNDKKFILESIEGYIYYEKNFENCFIKKNEIINTLSNLDREVEWVTKNYEDEEIKSEITYGIFKTGHLMMLYCNDYLNKKNDDLSVYIRTIEYHLWKSNNK